MIAPTLVVVLFAAAVSIAEAAAPDCSKYTGDKLKVCTAAVALEASVANVKRTESASCVIPRVETQLALLTFELPRAIGLFTVDFQLRRSVRQAADGLELSQQELFAGDPESIVWSDEDPASLEPGLCVASGPVRKELTESLGNLSSAMAAYRKPFMVEGAANLRKLANTWRWIITDGFGQYPWERAFNDFVHRETLSIYRLPGTEWVLAHPSVGMAVRDFDGFKDIRAQTALFIEPLGFIKYHFDVASEKRRYWGVSALVVITDDTSPALGALLRYNKFALGGVRHLKSASMPDRKWAVVATVELFERTQSARAKLQAARGKMESAGQTSDR